MLSSRYIIKTLRSSPSEAVIDSHKLMLRANLIAKLGNGLYAYMPLGLRVKEKVEAIIRRELNESGCLEIKSTVIVPGDIWKESGRWDTMGSQMLKAKNRSGQDMVVSPTAEEAFTYIVRNFLTSYKDLPFTLYQINTKYRDEIRPRYGVMRGREFTMMDAYSFDADASSLSKSYEAVTEAYKRIFSALGLKTIVVEADSGAMGGALSEEFMVESPIGDDTLVICPNCGYCANEEKASCKDDTGEAVPTDKPPEEVSTPAVYSIQDMEKFFGMSSRHFIKCLVYKALNSSIAPKEAQYPVDRDKDCAGGNTKDAGDGGVKVSYFCVCIRGDLEVNEAKLCALLKASEVMLADDAEVLSCSGTTHGFVGPLTSRVPIIEDLSVLGMHDGITGAGKADTHLLHVEPSRDYKSFLKADVRAVKEGDACPKCASSLYTKKGNELGHVFELGDKYTRSMGVQFLGEDGKAKTPIMGCYGIGVDRTIASIIEAYHDKDGIIWPLAVAPFKVVIVPVQYTGVMKEVALRIYSALEGAGVEVILDDRDERAGVKFKDWDLIGIPLRVVVGEKSLPKVELKLRANKEAELLGEDEVIARCLSC